MIVHTCGDCRVSFDDTDEYDEHQCAPMIDRWLLERDELDRRLIEAEAKERAAAMLAKERDRDNAYLAPPRSYWCDGVYNHVMVGVALRGTK